MRILIAPDSFKGSLAAKDVAKALAQGLYRADSSMDIELFPMADGGEGTVEALVASTHGKIIKTQVVGPLGDPVTASFGILADGMTGVIEMAAASGLPLIPPGSRNPLKTTTYGTGQLIQQALEAGCKKLIIGIGGSATNDCGVGMAQALGARFLDQSGIEVGLGGSELQRIQHIDLSNLDQRIAQTSIQVACDVDNPLYGPNGAAYVYAPQKGATPQMVEELDQGLKHLARIIQQDLGVEIVDLPGAGAAGGLGAGLVAFLTGELKPGIEIVLAASGLEKVMPTVDLVITGEGKIDFQTLNGKTPIGVARLAKKYGLSVIGIAGSIGEGAERVYEYGIDALFSIVNGPITLEESLQNAGKLLVNLGENLGRFLLIKK